MPLVKEAYHTAIDLREVVSSSVEHAQTRSIVLFLFLSCAVYTGVKSIARLYFHPLSNIPGPMLAAISGWYDFYYNVIHDGTYSSHWPRMHKKYDSSVIRIGVNHVHIADEDVYHNIYCSGTEYFKDPDFYDRLGLDGAGLTMTDPVQHRAYKNVVGPLFSTRMTDTLGDIMVAEVRRAADCMSRRAQEGHSVTIQRVYRSISADMVCELMFGKSLNLADNPDKYHDLLQSVDRFSAITWPKQYFPIINKLIAASPTALVNQFLPGFLGYRAKFMDWYEESRDRRALGQPFKKHQTFYDLIINNKWDTGQSGPDPEIVVNDSLNYVIAGMDTTSYTLAFATYYILSSKDVRDKLGQELEDAAPFIRTCIDLRKIERLPYVTAIIKEALRISVAAPGGLPRLVPKQGLRVGNTFIPGGTVIFFSHRTVQMSANIFPKPDEFIPERWLGRKGQELEKWNVAFSKGPRSCIGINLAYLEMYASIAYMFSRFEMELVETDKSCIESFDRFAARTKSQVKVKILRDRWKDEEERNE
ncbi:cytochrome P450 [Aspergillus karnatakaensis]|uniref:cytochrome P450 n=1 Tax=Aspergillus karnatakaensis TaxID=1810916 RepID=UPI003CCE05C0